jgi:hypothetical protein
MSSDSSLEKPVGVYLVALYFVLSGFLESIRKYQEAAHVWSWSPFAEESLWTLAVDPIIYLAIAYSSGDSPPSGGSRRSFMDTWCWRCTSVSRSRTSSFTRLSP